MSKKKRERTDNAPAVSNAPGGAAALTARPLAPVLLLALGAAEALLALFQWMELLVLRAGGGTVCKLNEVVDCQRVWETPFARAVHDTLGIPVAGLGLLWGLVAFALAAAWSHALLSGRTGSAQAAGIKLVALAGVASCVVFGWVSFAASALCLTCLTTYALVLVFAVVAWRTVPGPWFPAGADLRGALLWTGGAVVVGYLALLGPGLATPHAGGSEASKLSNLQPVKDPDQVAKAPADGGGQSTAPPRPMTNAELQALGYVRELPVEEQTMLSTARALYEAQDAVTQVPRPRVLYGPPDAKMDLVEWVDIRCPHCRVLVETLDELKRVAPKGALSVEPRNYPLDSECNPSVQRSDGTGLSCLGAKAMICLESQKDFWELRQKLFAAQAGLTKESLLELASSGELSRAELDRCLADPETERKLQDDIAYAMKFNPSGTPLVVVNGKEALPVGPFLYTLAMTGADTSSMVFQVLPPPGPEALGGHAGHGH